MSAVHWERIAEMGVAARFSLAFLSHEIGALKPAPEAFECALMGMGLTASEVVFLDDGARNVEAARALGMQAHLVHGAGEARSALQPYGLLS